MSGNHPSMAASGLRLAILAALGTGAALAAPAASAQSAEDEADLQQLSQELAALKASYAQEVRRLRELDMQVQALQARLAGKVPPAGAQAAAPVAATAAPIAPGQAPAQASAPQSSGEGYASTAAEAEAARKELPRSVADVKQATRTLFNQRLVIENGLPHSLLGMSYLGRLSSFTATPTTLTLKS